MNELRLLAETTGASESPTGFFGILLSGGLVGILILLVLAALSITAAYLLFDQIMTLRRKEVLPEGVSDIVRQALLTGRPAEADAAMPSSAQRPERCFTFRAFRIRIRLA